MPAMRLAFQLGHLALEGHVLEANANELSNGRGRAVRRQLDRDLRQSLWRLLPWTEQKQRRELDPTGVRQPLGGRGSTQEGSGLIAVQDVQMELRGGLHV